MIESILNYEKKNTHLVEPRHLHGDTQSLLPSNSSSSVPKHTQQCFCLK